MSSILNNLSAIGATRQLGISGINLGKTIERLTTGRRINSAVDDAAGLSISNRLTADIRVSGQAQRNANEGMSYLQVADGALDEVTALLTRASQLAQQARTGTISASNRANLDAEFQTILKTIINVGQNTSFNGQSVFSTTGGVNTLSVKAGDFGSITASLGSISSSATDALGMSTVGGTVVTPGSTQNLQSAVGTDVIAGQLNPAYNDSAYNTGFVAGFTFSSVALSDPNTTAAFTGATNAWWDRGTPATAHTDILGALTAANAYVVNHPTDPNGLAFQAIVAYEAAHVPAAGATGHLAENQAAVDAGVAAGAYTLVTPATTTSLPGTSLLTTTDAASTATLLAAALASVSSMRASIGASEAQLGATSDILGIQVQNYTAAQSSILDANVADEVVNLTKFQILNQSATSALSRSNQSAQQILALLQ